MSTTQPPQQRDTTAQDGTGGIDSTAVKDARDATDPRDSEDLGAAGAQLSTAPADTLAQTPGLGVLGWLRWMWRQLTSMRIALILLFLLSLASIPGSLIPQHSDQLKVTAFKKAHPHVSPLYERLGMFHVYSSPWFSAVYILLFVSLAGCIVPRSWQFVGQLRARPPAAPRNLDRLPAYSTWHTDASPEQVAEGARRALRGRRFRVSADGTSVAGEKGYLREAGNLLFHVALFGLLCSFAVTQLNAAQGGRLVVEGDGFVNNLAEYDDFTGGTLYGADDLQPFGFHLDSFEQKYSESGPDRGTALLFQANIHSWSGADGKQTKGSISVNHPLDIGGEKVYLISHGYAPVVTVRDGQGNVAFQGPVPFLPQDANLTSSGVVKVPDSIGKDGKPDQLAFSGFFTPTGSTDIGPLSFFPTLDQPILWLNAFHGDLGIDSGIAQNVYQLDSSHMKRYTLKDTKPGINALALTPGKTLTLPDGAGSLTFNGVKTWASFNVSHQAGNTAALASGVAAILGLMGSLFIQRRRIWVRARTAADGTTLVEMGGLGRSESARIADEIGDLAVQMQPDAPVRAETPTGADTPGTTDASADEDKPAGPGKPAGPDTSGEPDPTTGDAPTTPLPDDEGARA